MELSFKDRIQLSQDLVRVDMAVAKLRSNPQPRAPYLEELRQQYETVLGLLESEFLGALVSGKWEEFDQFVNDLKTECTTMTEGQGADELPTPSATTYPTTDHSNRKD